MSNQTQTTNAEAKILAALKLYTQRSGVQIGNMTDLPVSILYPALKRLEDTGRVISEWEDMEPPRRRRYRLAQGSESDA